MNRHAGFLTINGVYKLSAIGKNCSVAADVDVTANDPHMIHAQPFGFLQNEPQLFFGIAFPSLTGADRITHIGCKIRVIIIVFKFMPQAAKANDFSVAHPDRHIPCNLAFNGIQKTKPFGNTIIVFKIIHSGNPVRIIGNPYLFR